MLEERVEESLTKLMRLCNMINFPPEKRMKVVQLGTNRGNDHVNVLCKQLNPEFILLVEPHINHHDLIKENYKTLPQTILEPVAITIEDISKVTLYYLKSDVHEDINYGSYEIASLKKEHLGTISENDLAELEVSAITLNNLFEKYNLTYIDWLFIDVESLDFEIVKSIDFNKYNIQYIQIEVLHLDKDKLEEFMNTKGYVNTHTTIDKPGYDTIYKKI